MISTIRPELQLTLNGQMHCVQGKAKIEFFFCHFFRFSGFIYIRECSIFHFICFAYVSVEFVFVYFKFQSSLLRTLSLFFFGVCSSCVLIVFVMWMKLFELIEEDTEIQHARIPIT